MAEKSSKEYRKEMLPAERVAYTWYYYKWFILLAIAGALVIIFGVRYSMKTPRDFLAEVVMVNADQIEVDDTEFFDDFVSDYHYEDEELDLGFDTSLDIDLEEANSTSSSAYQVLAGMFLTGEVDVYMSDADIFDMEAENHAFTDLTEVLTPEQLEKYSDRLYYVEDPDTGEQVPYGISLEGTSFTDDENIYTDLTPIAGVGSQSDDYEIDRDILEYLLEHQADTQ